MSEDTESVLSYLKVHYHYSPTGLMNYKRSGPAISMMPLEHQVVMIV